MKSVWIACLLAPWILPSVAVQPAAPNALAQDRLMRVAPPPPMSEQDRTAWRDRLTAADLEQREQSFDALIEAAGRDAALRALLEEWSLDSVDTNLAWTARLALRELRGLAQRGTPLRRGFFFGDGLDPFADSQRLLDEMMRGMEPWGNRGGLPPSAGGSTTSSAESFSLESGPDGVKCKVTTQEDGREVTEEYSAKSIDELLEAHPELGAKIGARTFDPFGGAFPPGLSLRLGSPRAAQPATPFQTFQVRTDVLGVVVEPLSAEDGQKFGLEAGVGLRIERVEPGTIAHQLGLQRGHVLFEINGTTIHSRDDISNEIRKRGSDGALDVVVIDRWGQKRTRTWKPNSEKQI